MNFCCTCKYNKSRARLNSYFMMKDKLQMSHRHNEKKSNYGKIENLPIQEQIRIAQKSSHKNLTKKCRTMYKYQRSICNVDYETTNSNSLVFTIFLLY